MRTVCYRWGTLARKLLLLRARAGDIMGVTRRRAALAGRRRDRLGQKIPLRAYVAGLVVLFMAVAAVNVVYQRQASLHNARQAALAGAGYAAQDCGSVSRR